MLAELVFNGNPLEEKHSAEGDWLEKVSEKITSLKKIDGNPIVREDEEED
jgi:dynein light chain 1